MRCGESFVLQSRRRGELNLRQLAVHLLHQPLEQAGVEQVGNGIPAVGRRLGRYEAVARLVPRRGDAEASEN
jgi:hypothetical protein